MQGLVFTTLALSAGLGFAAHSAEQAGHMPGVTRFIDRYEVAYSDIDVSKQARSSIAMQTAKRHNWVVITETGAGVIELSQPMTEARCKGVLEKAASPAAKANDFASVACIDVSTGRFIKLD